MKKLFSFTSLIFLILALITVSCEKSPGELLIGKWEIKSLKIKIYSNNVYQSEATVSYDADAMVLEFLEGGVGKEYADNALEGTFAWVIDGDVCTITYTGEEAFDVTLTVDEDDLTFTMEESETDEEIVYKYVMTFAAKRV